MKRYPQLPSTRVSQATLEAIKHARGDVSHAKFQLRAIQATYGGRETPHGKLGDVIERELS